MYLYIYRYMSIHGTTDYCFTVTKSPASQSKMWRNYIYIYIQMYKGIYMYIYTYI